MTVRSIQELEALREACRRERTGRRTRILVCSTGCQALGAKQVLIALREAVRRNHLDEQVEIVETGCQGICARAPVVTVYPQNVLYGQVSPDDAEEIITQTVKMGKIVDRLCVAENGQVVAHPNDLSFFRSQKRVVLKNCGRIDPHKITDYLATGGYSALAKALADLSPEEIISEVMESGLRGRGGAGFPTGRKWQFTRQAEGHPKYVICNADEGDPGAFMDRALLEGDPHRVIEGMIIAARAIGATEGYIYVRAEYPIAVQNTIIALDQAREWGIIGHNILGSGLDFDIHVQQGAGAFVCGEETALIASLEGRRGMPRARPPFPAQKGLWGKPTNINNVETFANVPLIIERGSAWYRSMGTEGSKGTKIFALAGKVRNTGLVEVPMGATLRQIVYEIGGGIPNDLDFKAAQMGGPSGGCVPAKYLDLPIDYDSVRGVGAIMGSGGLIVMDETTCMVDAARYFMSFVQTESCGKCAPCRVGTKHMLDILTRITSGNGVEGDVERLEALALDVKASARCGLGQTAPNPVLSTIRYFRDEYDAHILDKRCPAAVCRGMFDYVIDADSCTGCHACVRVCPVSAITGDRKQPHAIIADLCIDCGRCFDACAFHAIRKECPDPVRAAA